MLRLLNLRPPAFVASCAILALSTGCLKDTLRGGDNKPKARTDQGGPSGPVGGDSWVFNFSRTEQAAGGGMGLAAMGWAYAGWGSRRHRKAMETVIGAIEEGDCKECKKQVHRACNRWLNRRVAKLTKGP